VKAGAKSEKRKAKSEKRKAKSEKRKAGPSASLGMTMREKIVAYAFASRVLRGSG
jgi:hypothetical protein